MRHKANFRQELAIKADEYEKNINIVEKIENIKNQLEGYFYKREYIISLVKVTESSVAIGHNNVGRTSIFVPYGVPPMYYRQLFINELQKLGFSEECMELSVKKHPCFDSYDIKLKW